MIRFLTISVFHSCIPVPAMIWFLAPGHLWLPCSHLITSWAKPPYGASAWEWCSRKFWQPQMEEITGELELWACLQWEQWFKPLFFPTPLFPARFSQIFAAFGGFDLWGKILRVAGRQHMCFVPLRSWNDPKSERGGFSCSVSSVVQKEDGGRRVPCLSWDKPDVLELCFFRNGVESAPTKRQQLKSKQ